MKVRPADKEDKNILRKFQFKMAKETENTELDEKKLSKGVNAVLNDAQKARYFIAEENKMPVGCFMVTPEWSDWRGGYFIWLQSVFVEKEFRQKGVFKAMYEYLKDIVQNNADYIGIRLYVHSENNDAIEVYKNSGLKECDYVMMEWDKDNQE